MDLLTAGSTDEMLSAFKSAGVPGAKSGGVTLVTSLFTVAFVVAVILLTAAVAGVLEATVPF